MANSVDPDQEQSDLGLHCLPDLSVRKLRIIMVNWGQDLLCCMVYGKML